MFKVKEGTDDLVLVKKWVDYISLKINYRMTLNNWVEKKSNSN